MTWQLRQVLPIHFNVAFTDADPASNRVLNECEESLFLHPDEAALVPLGNLIRKTELQGELYDTVAYGQQTVSYPRPFLFTMQPREGHPAGDRARPARMLCLYDNAGEHFQPGQDTTSSPVTRHLAQSRAIIFLFDPTQDPRFRAACRGSGDRRIGAACRAAEPPGDDPQRGGRADSPPRRPVPRQQVSTGRWSSSSPSSTSGRTCSTATTGDPWRDAGKRHRCRRGADRADIGPPA